MESGEFEWDDDKAEKNLREHKVSFETACRVFDDPFALEWEDDREHYNELRLITLGVVDGRMLFVVHTPRNDRTHIISAREARPHEKRRYHEEDSKD
jgi:uncharacterized protein